MKVNRLNNLSAKDWLKFQKSWFIHNPPPRSKDMVRHPAKFPETLAQEFIEFFTKPEATVFDPMMGVGSALVACIRSGRHGWGIEINKDYYTLAGEWCQEEAKLVDHISSYQIINADAREIDNLALPTMDYCITSPPYWDMLHAKGAETQVKRRNDDELDVVYSEDPNDLGNIHDYYTFLKELIKIYAKVTSTLADRAYMTVIVKNIKKKGTIYPLAWDLGRFIPIATDLVLKDEKIWCQDNQKLFPYGMGNAWVSNTFHHYCLNFRKEAG